MRHYWKCRDCLSVAVTETDESKLACACGGTFRHMGEVKGQRVVAWRSETPCDERCTHAAGPNCECPCGGVNHGTGHVLHVARDQGPIPMVTPPNTERAVEFRAAMEAAEKRIERVHGATIKAKEEGRWVSDDAYWAWRRDDDRLDAAARFKNHKTRMSALAKVCAEVPA